MSWYETTKIGGIVCDKGKQTGTPRLVIRPLNDEDVPNIYCEIPEGKMLNIPKADYHFDVIRFQSLDCDQIEDAKAFIIKRLGKNDSISGWLRKEKKFKSQNGQETKSNEDLVQPEFGCWINRDTVPSAHSYLLVDQPIRGGIIITEPDKYGFFKVRNNCNDEDELWCVLGDHGAPSLYRGSLVF